MKTFKSGVLVVALLLILPFNLLVAQEVVSVLVDPPPADTGTVDGSGTSIDPSVDIGASETGSTTDVPADSGSSGATDGSVTDTTTDTGSGGADTGGTTDGSSVVDTGSSTADGTSTDGGGTDTGGTTDNPPADSGSTADTGGSSADSGSTDAGSGTIDGGGTDTSTDTGGTTTGGSSGGETGGSTSGGTSADGNVTDSGTPDTGSGTTDGSTTGDGSSETPTDGNTGTGQNDETPIPPPPLVINEVMVGSEVNPAKDSWFELHNTTSEAILLNEWKIRGITAGGTWVSITTDPALAVEPDGYFVVSYYTNSSYSALALPPQATKSSLLFAPGSITIELKDPSGIIVDMAVFDHLAEENFRSYERNQPVEDGTLATSWSRPQMAVSLKPNLTQTFATPGSVNSLYLPEESNTGAQNDGGTGTDTPTDTGDSGTSDAGSGATDGSATGSSNDGATTNPPPVSYPTYRLINEIMPNPEGDDTQGEWIELFNSTSSSIDLGGWYVDDADGASSPYRLSEGTMLDPGTFWVISEPGLGLSLKNSDDQVRLLDPNKEAKETISYTGAKEGWTYAKKQDGEWAWTPLVTQGLPNDFPPPPRAYQVGDVTFAGVLPNPDGTDTGLERVILRNHLSETIDLEGWALVNLAGKAYGLGEWTLSPLEKNKLNPADVGLSLVNKADKLTLMDPTGNPIDHIAWQEADSGQMIYPFTPFGEGILADVVRVVDGDTFKVLIDGDEFTIRLIGVDTPEIVHPKKEVEAFGKEASDYLKNLLEGKTVSLSFDATIADKYSRLLAYVYLNGQLVNADILKNGYGYAYTYFPFTKMDEFIAYQEMAQQAGVGIWKNEEAAQLIIETADEENETEEVAEEEKADNQTEADESEDDEEKTDVSTTADTTSDCDHEGLKIDAILPNAEKGVSVESIRLVNMSDQKICLKGWQLDDSVGQGSKPFTIKGGAIAQGGVRTFRAEETHLSLNNSNDCATLIRPSGAIADQICYNKTHKNEWFNHEGGDWKPAPKAAAKTTAKKKSSSASKAKKPPAPETVSYQWELKNETLEGTIAFVYEDGDLLYLKNDEKIIPVSYAGSHVDIAMTKELLDFSEPVTLQVRAAGDDRQLIGIEQTSHIPSAADKSGWPKELLYLAALLLIVGGWFGWHRYGEMVKKGVGWSAT